MNRKSDGDEQFLLALPQTVMKYREHGYAGGLPGIPASGCIRAVTEEFDAAAKVPIRDNEDDRQYAARVGLAGSLKQRWLRVMTDDAGAPTRDDFLIVKSWLRYEPLTRFGNVLQEPAHFNDVPRWFQYYPTPEGPIPWDEFEKDVDHVEAFALRYPADAPEQRGPCVAKLLHRWVTTMEHAAQSQAEKRVREAAETAERERVAARADVLGRRFAPLKQECATNWSSTSTKCTELPGLSDEERAQCQEACADAAEAARTKVLDDARASCIETWADTGVPSVCNLEVPDGAKPDPQWLKSETASCSAECRKQGPEARRERVLAQQRAAREAAAERARNPGPSASTRFCRSQCKSQGMSCLEQNCGCDNPNVSCPLTACSAACLRQKNACDARCGD